VIGGSYSDKRLVRFPSSFGTGPDSALMPTVLVISKEKNVNKIAEKLGTAARFLFQSITLIPEQLVLQ
jgi:hypothetical protein